MWQVAAVTMTLTAAATSRAAARVATAASRVVARVVTVASRVVARVDTVVVSLRVERYPG